MVFSSLLFVFAFLPLFFAVYYCTPARFKNAVALIASCLFYAWGAAGVFGVLVGGLLIDYVVAGAIAAINPETESGRRTRKRLVALAIVINVAALGYFKYANFFVDQVNAVLRAFGSGPLRWSEVLLPVGISFFTFHKISYVVDVYRRRSPPATSFITFCLYVLLFPQLIAGPIIRYHDVDTQLAARRHTSPWIAYGAYRFCMGLGKKVLIANPLATTADMVFGLQPECVTTFQAWLGLVCYTFQVYLDFSGYSDMALGLGYMLGIRFRENFDCPYVSSSVTEFWRRWHISLSSWMKEYLYVPLGGNRVSLARTYVNLWVVFLLSGLWHGASWTFVIWGAWHGTFLVLERLGQRTRLLLPRALGTAFTFLTVMIGWSFFRSADLGSAARLLGRMAGVTHYVVTPESPITAELISSRGVAALVAAAFVSFVPWFAFGKRLARTFEEPQIRLGGASLRYASALFCLLLSCSSLANSGYNPFIYFRF
jgi:alginate O-acetyltransferase complex protein AlgI